MNTAPREKATPGGEGETSRPGPDTTDHLAGPQSKCDCLPGSGNTEPGPLESLRPGIHSLPLPEERQAMCGTCPHEGQLQARQERHTCLLF